MSTARFDASVNFEMPGLLEEVIADAMHEAGIYRGEHITAIVTKHPLPGECDSAGLLFTFPHTWENLNYHFDFNSQDWYAKAYSAEELAHLLRLKAGLL